MEKLYFTVPNYNKARILNALSELISQDGGRVINRRKEYIRVYARTSECDPERVARVKALPGVETLFAGIFGASISFALNNIYVSLSFDDNPFFPIIYNKIIIQDDGSYHGRRYAYSSDDINDKAWKKDKNIVFTIAFDNLFNICDDDAILSMAQAFYNQVKTYVIAGPESEKYSERKRVPNYYNNSYHYENIIDNTLLNVYK